MDSSSDSDDLNNLIRDMNDPINDEKWDSTWSKFYGALK